MLQIKVIIKDTTDRYDVFPTVTPWWDNGKCLLVGCSLNKDLNCMKSRESASNFCIHELPQPIGCRFHILKEDE